MTSDHAGPGPSVREFYSSQADAYKEMWGPELLPLARLLLDELPLRDVSSVLEVGSGVGMLLPDLRRAAPGATVVGTDLAEGMIALAPRDTPIAVMDAARLAVADASFDVCLLPFVLFHLPEPPLGVGEAARVLRPGGWVATATWGQEQGYRALDIWNEELDLRGARPAGSFANHELLDTTDKMKDLLGGYGFDVLRTWTDEYVNPMTADDFLRHRIGHGVSRLRLGSLPEVERGVCVESVRGRLEGLAGSDLEQRGEVIFAVGRKRA